MKQKNIPLWLRKIGIIFAVLGPGLITASADNDAPGIATYSMIGSKYGYTFLWIVVAITIGEVVVQEIAAHGSGDCKGTADLIREIRRQDDRLRHADPADRELRHHLRSICGYRAAGELLELANTSRFPRRDHHQRPDSEGQLQTR